MTNRPAIHANARTCLAVLFCAGTWCALRGQELASPPELAKRARQPIALACVDDGKTLIVANQQSGSLSVVDTAKRQVVVEYDVGQRLSDLVVLPDKAHLLALDQAADLVLLISCHERSLEVIARAKVSAEPIKLAVSPDGSGCAVASLWSRRVTFFSVGAPPRPRGHATLSLDDPIDLPFCPRELAFAPDGSKLVVTDAFGGRIAVVGVKSRKVESIRALPAHNIRGLAFARDGRTLVLAHQMLSRLAQTKFDDVHWGLVIRNHLRVLQTDALFKPGLDDAALLAGGRLYDLGDVGYAAGDPGAVAFDRSGTLIVALAGVDEVAITASPDQGPRRVVVGRRPMALAPCPDGSVVYVADSLADTVSVVNIATGQRPATIALGPPRVPTAPERGASLFYSAKLSHDGWMSCHSCHSDGHTNNLVSDTLGDGSYGAPKRVPSLLGVSRTGPWTWTGSIARLEDQVKKSIVTTMQGQKPSDQQVTDLTAYLATLALPLAARSGTHEIDAPSIARGRAIFDSHKCADCHVPPEYTSAERFDVGLTDEVGNHEFNPPSLNGVNSRDSLLHDGRAHSLEDVFRKERHPRGLVLTPSEIDALIAFLKTL